MKRKDADAAARYLEEIDSYPELLQNDVTWRVRRNIVAASIQMLRYDFDGAAETVRQSLAIPGADELTVEYLLLLMVLAESGLKRNDLEAARSGLLQARERAEAAKVFEVAWNIRKVLATVDILDEQFDTAEQTLEQLVQEAEERDFRALADDAQELLERVRRTRVATAGYETVEQIAAEEEEYQVSAEEVNDYIDSVKTMLARLRLTAG